MRSDLDRLGRDLQDACGSPRTAAARLASMPSQPATLHRTGFIELRHSALIQSPPAMPSGVRNQSLGPKSEEAGQLGLASAHQLGRGGNRMWSVISLPERRFDEVWRGIERIGLFEARG